MGGVYTRLVADGVAHGAEPFSLHVAAGLVALAMHEADTGDRPLAVGLGLEPWEVQALFLHLFPDAWPLVEPGLTACGAPEADEAALSALLWYHAAGSGPFDRALVRMVARRCLRPNHLWQDLGLGSRRELGVLMQRHFPVLAARNTADMKWKKFLYRALCSATGYGMCTAPICTDCDDFTSCFGAESGESLLAATRNGRHPAVPEQRL
jgi:nitrogen fixation protein NifQ